MIIRSFAIAVTVLFLLAGNDIFAQDRPLVRLANEHAYSLIAFDILEVAPISDGGPIDWDVMGSFGRQYNRFWIKSEGALSTTATGVDVETQALYSRLISPFWELQTGVRLDVASQGDARYRAHWALGLEGLAPYWFELAPTIFVSHKGVISGTMTATYDLLVSQRIILQPRVDASLSAQRATAWGVGPGLNEVGAALRLRFELRREFAPYVGLQWTRLVGSTATMATNAGSVDRHKRLVFGIRLWH